MNTKNIKQTLLLATLWIPPYLYPFGGPLMFGYLLLLSALSAYLITTSLKSRFYAVLGASCISLVTALWVVFTPYTHLSIPAYIERNGEKIVNTHEHYYWEPGHIH